MLRSGLIIASLLISVINAAGQSVQPLKNAAPDGAQLTFQLTDGRVLAQGFNNTDWWVLTPDDKGKYVNGTWKQVASPPAGYSPIAMASQVLADGRVLIEGGEYNYGKFALTNLGAVYDPVKNTWTKLTPPRGWVNIGDSPSSVMPHGDFAIGNKLTEKIALLDPSTMRWRFLGATGKHDFNAEEGWTLLPDGSVLTVDVKDNPHAERYVITRGEWLDAGSTVVNLQGPPLCCGCTHYPPDNKCYYPPGEVGPALLMPDGTVFATGALHSGETKAHTAIYTPGSNSWAAGPDFPDGDQAGDEFASLLPNGHALVEGNSGILYEFDGKTLTAEPVNAGSASLMLLPSGFVLVGGFEIYSSNGTYQDSWRPTITGYPGTLARGSTYTISGSQFNGLSQANAFGDELQSSTNYPLVRIFNIASGHVIYARTHDHSSMAVATGNLTVSTQFDVPANAETGASSLVVVANGIPSHPVSVTVK
ncbi:MAG TPA: hypothetical protein VHT03_08000 [Rhizomicrobium sp.]|jgi:hypothetical protein|nr:hypothetical protein [Rhizomicrobium sp.]